MNAKLFAIFCAGLMLIGGCLAIFGTEDTDAANPGSTSDRQSVIYTTIDDFVQSNHYYLYVGAYINISVGDSSLYVHTIPSEISGTGKLTIGADGSLSGYIPVNGYHQVVVYDRDTGQPLDDSIMLDAKYQDGTDITINKGVFWYYTVQTSVDTVDTHLTSNVSGIGLEAQDEEELVSWTPSSTGTAKVVISVRSTSPVQCAIQTLNITVVESIDPVATTSAPWIYVVAGGSIPNSVREAVLTSTNIDGATWSVQGTNNTGLTITSAGVIGGTAASSPGTHTITLKATGSTDTATCSLTVYIVAKLVITSTPTGNA